MKKFFLVLFLIIFVGCVSNDYIPICDNYYFDNNKFVRISHYNDDIDQIDRIIVPWDVRDWTYDDTYIQVFQVVEKDTSIYSWLKGNYYPKEYNDSIDSLVLKMKRIRYCYWIIRRCDEKVIGPMDKHAYLDKCRSIGLETDLVK